MTRSRRTSLSREAARLRPLRDELASLIDRDSEAYTSVINAYRLPRSTVAEQAARRDAIDEAMRAATEAPLATIRACERAMREAEVIVSSGAASASSDVAVGIELLKTAARGAGMNVDTNLAAVKDDEYVQRVSQELRDLEQAMEDLLPSRS